MRAVFMGALCAVAMVASEEAKAEAAKFFAADLTN
jgi:hypothetical protein